MQSTPPGRPRASGCRGSSRGMEVRAIRRFRCLSNCIEQRCSGGALLPWRANESESQRPAGDAVAKGVRDRKSGRVQAHQQPAGGQIRRSSSGASGLSNETATKNATKADDAKAYTVSRRCCDFRKGMCAGFVELMDADRLDELERTRAAAEAASRLGRRSPLEVLLLAKQRIRARRTTSPPTAFLFQRRTALGVDDSRVFGHWGNLAVGAGGQVQRR